MIFFKLESFILDLFIFSPDHIYLEHPADEHKFLGNYNVCNCLNLNDLGTLVTSVVFMCVEECNIRWLERVILVERLRVNCTD